ncbi:MAG TPA: cytochrome o ubiquinol oxidase subunit III, partial [Brevundimonas sp.]|nr:cytochrome o ubiquinol oxidase subunit III [Brevundimonas sp.]
MSATAIKLDDPTVFHLEEEPHHEEGSSTMLGFWLYLMSDCLIFAMLFAVFGVLGGNYAAGPGPKELFDLELVAVNTAMLLFSSITYGFAMLA